MRNCESGAKSPDENAHIGGMTFLTITLFNLINPRFVRGWELNYNVM